MCGMQTTTLKMLTGDIIPGSGTATLQGLDILTHQNSVRRLLGYCPQFDALIDVTPLTMHTHCAAHAEERRRQHNHSNSCCLSSHTLRCSTVRLVPCCACWRRMCQTLTAREHLALFARIKGVPEEIIPDYCEHLILRLGLQEGIADKPSKGYSGGNKRKLCVGMALIGNPPIVFLYATPHFTRTPSTHAHGALCHSVCVCIDGRHVTRLSHAGSNLIYVPAQHARSPVHRAVCACVCCCFALCLSCV